MRINYNCGFTHTICERSMGYGTRMEGESTQEESTRHATLLRHTTTCQYMDTLELPEWYS
jgi:hypothetical protein